MDSINIITDTIVELVKVVLSPLGDVLGGIYDAFEGGSTELSSVLTSADADVDVDPDVVETGTETEGGTSEENVED